MLNPKTGLRQLDPVGRGRVMWGRPHPESRGKRKSHTRQHEMH